MAARGILMYHYVAQLTWFWERVLRDTLHGAKHQRIREEVQWTINEAGLYLPGETFCFEQYPQTNLS